MRTRGAIVAHRAGYLDWIRRFILFHRKRHPRDMGEPEIVEFLTFPAMKQNVSASTQNQTLPSSRFAYVIA
jgi:hypothetical protein